MGIYEYDRIRHKQQRYLTQQAESEIQRLRDQGITDARILNLCRQRSTDTTLNETQRDIYTVATKLMEA
jgi:hypothetical protein